jgi:hypothetical protein
MGADDIRRGPTVIPRTHCSLSGTDEVELGNPASEEAGVSWREELTGRGSEGMVVKPPDLIACGSRGLVLALESEPVDPRPQETDQQHSTSTTDQMRVSTPARLSNPGS